MSQTKSKIGRRRFLNTVASGAAGLAFASSGGALASPSKSSMSHRRRIENALALKETDRLPFGFWWHFPNRDRSPRRLAELALGLQRKLDLDFIKFAPYGLYSVVDWGVTVNTRGGHQTPIQADYPIKEPKDWQKLRTFGGTEGEYLVVLEAQRIALEEMTDRVPLVQTVFSPLTSCLKMVGREALLTHIREAPDAVHAGLEIVAETTRRFAAEVVTRGADGLFFASQTTNQGYLTPDEYTEFAKPYDLSVLEAAAGRSWFNIFHLHGQDIMFDKVLDYPVQAFNYHDRESGPPLAKLRTITNKCLIGGIGQNTTLVDGTPKDVNAQVKDAWAQVDRRGLILGPGCVANLNAPEENLLELRKSVEETAL
jgi:uroporphyrinogen decarboxylase